MKIDKAYPYHIRNVRTLPNQYEEKIDKTFISPETEIEDVAEHIIESSFIQLNYKSIYIEIGLNGKYQWVFVRKD